VDVRASSRVAGSPGTGPTARLRDLSMRGDGLGQRPRRLRPVPASRPALSPLRWLRVAGPGMAPGPQRLLATHDGRRSWPRPPLPPVQGSASADSADYAIGSVHRVNTVRAGPRTPEPIDLHAPIHADEAGARRSDSAICRLCSGEVATFCCRVAAVAPDGRLPGRPPARGFCRLGRMTESPYVLTAEFSGLVPGERAGSGHQVVNRAGGSVWPAPWRWSPPGTTCQHTRRACRCAFRAPGERVPPEGNGRLRGGCTLRVAASV
jgi:hypothetical protein